MDRNIKIPPEVVHVRNILKAINKRLKARSNSPKIQEQPRRYTKK